MFALALYIAYGWWQLFGVWCHVLFVALCLVWHLVARVLMCSGRGCCAVGVLCLMLGVLCVVYSVLCFVCSVLCVMCRVWCVACDR